MKSLVRPYLKKNYFCHQNYGLRLMAYGCPNEKGGSVIVGLP